MPFFAETERKAGKKGEGRRKPGENRDVVTGGYGDDGLSSLWVVQLFAIERGRRGEWVGGGG